MNISPLLHCAKTVWQVHLAGLSNPVSFGLSEGNWRRKMPEINLKFFPSYQLGKEDCRLFKPVLQGKLKQIASEASGLNKLR